MMIDHTGYIASFTSEKWAEVTQVEGLGGLICSHGLDLGNAGAGPGFIERGTPVYVEEDADPSRVLRRMAEAHVRFLFVIRSGEVVGVVDILELAERAAALVWPDGAGAPPNHVSRANHGKSLP